MTKSLMDARISEKQASSSRPIMTGVLGYPIGHSLSMVMHNTAYDFLGLNFFYSAHAVPQDRLKQAVEGIRALGYRGVNVTIPHKVAVMDLLDEIADEAAEIGAVNTIVCEDGKLVGYNTDGIGYIQSFEEELGISLSGSSVLLLGAGGAGRAVAVSLVRKGISRLYILDQREEAAQNLARSLSSRAHAEAVSMETLLQRGLAGIDILINATPVGLSPHVDNLPIPAHLLHSDLIVSDLIYNPHETALLKAAKKIGARLHHGIGMLVHQGALSFQIWTDRPAPMDVMRKAVLSELASSD
jgi:shikimate dehydrogenase